MGSNNARLILLKHHWYYFSAFILVILAFLQRHLMSMMATEAAVLGLQLWKKEGEKEKEKRIHFLSDLGTPHMNWTEPRLRGFAGVMYLSHSSGVCGFLVSHFVL